MIEQWRELKETIIEMRDNDGTGTQQEVCKFLANLMDVLEKQMNDSENPNKGEWIEKEGREQGYDIGGVKSWYIQIACNKCGFIKTAIEGHTSQYNFCPNCGADMRGKSCRCNTCKNNDDELSGECYECVKGIFDHYEKKRR